VSILDDEEFRNQLKAATEEDRSSKKTSVGGAVAVALLGLLLMGSMAAPVFIWPNNSSWYVRLMNADAGVMLQDLRKSLWR